ncbi:hypothetical protein DUZ99_08095 [Xylanibacillus composti]|uniref:Uncharacterized protein n=1 Tax=Xylanibacillus composti TaxID=1572762 RepID=A0A8J4M163_9BACL|nr:hypothetical protein [Xylanibacillus composti]MDT9724954.1 hypothetical protein [Xylanibacillus composti]GIQ68194.1 hypothetical protein XYCOK13_10180 [Xylanibacillus composti]
MEQQIIIQAAIRLFNREPVQALSPEHSWDESLGKEIRAWDPGTSAHARALKSGLLLWNDELDESHAISQSLDTQEGSYWHGIMHRMETDYSNAKYWFARTGKHDVHSSLLEVSSALIEQSREELLHAIEELSSRKAAHRRACLSIAEWDRWDASTYVNLVEAQSHADDEASGRLLRRIQRTEMALLLDYSYHAEFGGRLFESLVQS